eukprot:109893_1
MNVTFGATKQYDMHQDHEFRIAGNYSVHNHTALHRIALVTSEFYIAKQDESRMDMNITIHYLKAIDHIQDIQELYRDSMKRYANKIATKGTVKADNSITNRIYLENARSYYQNTYAFIDHESCKKLEIARNIA